LLLAVVEVVEVQAPSVAEVVVLAACLLVMQALPLALHTL
jgi:hypothetical protein